MIWKIVLGFLIWAASCYAGYRIGFNAGTESVIPSPVKIVTSTRKLVPLEAAVVINKEDLLRPGVEYYINNALKDEIASEIMEFVEVRSQYDFQRDQEVFKARLYVAERSEG